MVSEILFGAIGFWVVACAIVSALAYVLYHNWAVLQYLARFLCARAIAQYRTSSNVTVTDTFDKQVRARPNHTAIMFEDTSLTFSEFDRIANAVANWVIEGQKNGSFPSFDSKPCIGLVFESRPEFIALWLGFAKVGVKSALVNATIKGRPLVHALAEASATMLIYGKECESQVFDVVDEIHDKGIPIFCLDDVRIVSKPISSQDKTIPLQVFVSSSHRMLGEPTFSPLLSSTTMFTDAKEYRGVLLTLDDFTSPDSTISSNLASKLISSPSFPSKVTSLLPILLRSSTSSISKSASPLRLSVTCRDTLFYIYTSGTTGLPKAAKISHSRFEMAGLSYVYMHALSSDDIIYCVLPLYHSAGGMLGLSTSWMLGSTLALRRKFSASAFFADCVTFRATVVQYIGQLCRYLVATPPSPFDRAHCVQKALGNGLRKDVWIEFRRRFEIPYVGEFYGSTEGNCSLVNTFGQEGACGFLPPITRPFYPVRIIKIVGEDGGDMEISKTLSPASQSENVSGEDNLTRALVDVILDDELDSTVDIDRNAETDESEIMDSERQRLVPARGKSSHGSGLSSITRNPMDPVRGPDGLCIEADDDECGELLGKIVDTDPYRNWEGYSNKEESDRKVLRNVFTKGDAWFRTGDLMTKDKNHYIYFVDRLGDTFRWKGENCSCSEVENAVMASELVEDCIVYGVTVPGYDGRAGMVSAILKSTIAVDEAGTLLFQHLLAHLASWQMPVFARFVTSLDLTATLKHNKVAAQKRGWGAQLSGSFVLDFRQKKYVPLDSTIEQGIASGRTRL